MLSPQALFKLLVARALPQAAADGPESERTVRGGRYGELSMLSMVRKAHLLAEEGTYFTANNGTTGITGQTDTAFTAIHPTISIYNSDSPGNSQAKRISLDYIHLLSGTAFTNATSNTGTFAAVVTDSQDGVTGGTLLTNNCVNQDVPKSSSVAIIRVGALVAPTASASSRTIVGQRLVRAPVSATALTLANLDMFHLNFGGVEPNMALPNAASATLEANVVGRIIPLPPVVIGPGQSAWIYVFSVSGGAVTAGTFLPELGWWER